MPDARNQTEVGPDSQVVNTLRLGLTGMAKFLWEPTSVYVFPTSALTPSVKTLALRVTRYKQGSRIPSLAAHGRRL